MLRIGSIFTVITLLSSLVLYVFLGNNHADASPYKYQLSKLYKIGSDTKGTPYYIGGFSGLLHLPADPPNIFYTISDRGPNADDTSGIAKTAVSKVFPNPLILHRYLRFHYKMAALMF